MLLAVTLTLLLGTARAGGECEELHPPPGSLQVAWVSPVKKRVRARTELSVVRVADLRAWLQVEGADPVRALQGLGLVGRKGLRLFTPKRWKITIFDVDADWLCRPVEYASPGELVSGLPACPPGREAGARHRSGCGTTVDTLTDEELLQRFRITWKAAASRGFCVMPLERFVSGA